MKTVAPEALSALEAQNWFGNVRELQSAVKYALVRSRGEVLTLDCLPTSVVPPAPGAPMPETGASTLDLAALVSALLRAGEPDIYRQVGLVVDRVVLEATLRYTKGNQVQASELLGISRTTLRAKLRSLGLTVEKQIYAGSEDGE